MKLAHFVITRFCLRGRRMHGGVDGPWFGSVDPLKARTVDLRLKLLETTCLPGLASQTSQEFTWVLLVDARLREDFKERLRNLARARDRVCLHEHRPDAPDRLETLGWLAPLLADRPEYVLTTLNDDDDVLPRRFVEVVQSHVFDLDERGRAPPYKLMGVRRVVAWDMVFTPAAPLGWAAPWRGAVSVPPCGFTLLCRYPAFDFSVLGMKSYWAETYFDFHTPPPAENVRIYRQSLLEAARDARAGYVPMGDDAFFDASPRAGAVLMSNHGANLQSWRLSYRPGLRPRPEGGSVPHRRVLGPETFPDVSVDWDAARRHARHFSLWRVGSRLLAQKLYGHKGGNLDAVRRLGERVRSLLHTRYCPVCGNSSFRFQDAGMNHRADARCGRCDSLERHRLIWLYLERTYGIRSFPGKMLDVSPAPSLANGLRLLLGDRYLSAGKGSADMERMDVQDMPYEDRTFDLVCCSHVLEHVENDRKAMSEIARVLKNGGPAIILVPISSGSTHEDPAITSPADRLLHFGSPNHVRRYGLDFVERLKAAGFNVRIVRAADFLSAHEIEKMRIRHRVRSGQPAVEEDLIFHCTKAGWKDAINGARQVP